MKALRDFALPLLAVAMLIVSISVSIRLLRSEPVAGGSEFFLVQLGDMQRNQFLVDKKNGRIWQKVCAGDVNYATCDGELIWEEMYVTNLTPQSSNVTQAYLEGSYARAVEKENKMKAKSAPPPAQSPLKKGGIKVQPTELFQAQRFCNTALPPGTKGKKYEECISQFAYSTGG